MATSKRSRGSLDFVERARLPALAADITQTVLGDIVSKMKTPESREIVATIDGLEITDDREQRWLSRAR
ncbi:MAG: hypothetical protein QHC67_10390 [Sphingobium sp.]|uniref:hypothetical protein n=1 Tax=Sphingobium sp. TaxID=1912891 RepID=UPI0029ABF04D|nr:hypothetical protein [Sphingobium sp.]MDX3910213.1 hypothetical protein [Sphingobium sp.]